MSSNYVYFLKWNTLNFFTYMSHSLLCSARLKLAVLIIQMHAKRTKNSCPGVWTANACVLCSSTKPYMKYNWKWCKIQMKQQLTVKKKKQMIMSDWSGNFMKLLKYKTEAINRYYLKHESASGQSTEAGIKSSQFLRKWITIVAVMNSAACRSLVYLQALPNCFTAS